jgi:hypothetical protein
MNRTLARSIALFASLSLIVALAQPQQRSVRSSLTALKTLVAWKAATGIVPAANLKLERSQAYTVALRLNDARTELGLLMGANSNNAFVHYVSVVYQGPLVRDAGRAHGYLSKVVALACMGLTERDFSRVQRLVDNVVSRFKTEPVSDSLSGGPLTVGASAAMRDGQMNVILVMKRSDAPSKTWTSYCGFEP